jgi:5-methylcytosine-specific restriction enzyme A
MPTELFRPKSKETTYDLLKKIGLDVSDWKNRAVPAANPKYCYNWVFVENKNLIVFNIWFEGIGKSGDEFHYYLNPKEGAKKESGLRKKRAEDMDAALELAWNSQIPVNVILLVERKFISEASAKGNARVAKRGLDTELWVVENYDTATGEAKITRNNTIFVDQFSVIESKIDLPERVIREVGVYLRDPKIREKVRFRSAGKCEYCGVLGFKTSNGAIYVETHHVVPLSENGLDCVRNVAALCPDHHRQAHFGLLAENIRIALQQMLNRDDTN